GQGGDPAAHRGRGPEGDPVRRRAGRTPAGKRLRPRPADGSEVPRGHRPRQLGPAPPAEGDFRSPEGTGPSLTGKTSAVTGGSGGWEEPRGGGVSWPCAPWAARPHRSGRDAP